MQTIKQLIQGLDVQLSNVEVEVVVTTIVEHSRRVVPGACFVARSGHRRDGAAFIDDAIERGANVIVCTPDVADTLKHKAIIHTPSQILATFIKMCQRAMLLPARPICNSQPEVPVQGNSKRGHSGFPVRRYKS